MVPDNFEGLTEQEKKLAMQMLEEFSKTGDSKTFEEIKYQDYEEIPVDIETFLHDRRYLGNGLYDSSGRFTIYPYWEKTLKDIFPDNITTKYNTLILTGAIGLGKTQIACVCLLYILYRLLCLKDPYLFYGLQPIDKISISLMNITLENAKGVALDKINQMILSSEWFMSHGEMRGTTNLEYVPEKHIELITASSNNQVVGRCLFCLDGNTVIATSDGDKKLKDIVDKPIKVLTLGNNNELTLSNTCFVKPTLVSNEEYRVVLEDDTVIECTPNHRLLLKDGTYKEARLLTEDDELMDMHIIGSNGVINH